MESDIIAPEKETPVNLRHVFSFLQTDAQSLLPDCLCLWLPLIPTIVWQMRHESQSWDSIHCLNRKISEPYNWPPAFIVWTQQRTDRHTLPHLQPSFFILKMQLPSPTHSPTDEFCMNWSWSFHPVIYKLWTSSGNVCALNKFLEWVERIESAISTSTVWIPVHLQPPFLVVSCLETGLGGGENESIKKENKTRVYFFLLSTKHNYKCKIHLAIKWMAIPPMK